MSQVPGDPAIQYGWVILNSRVLARLEHEALCVYANQDPCLAAVVVKHDLFNTLMMELSYLT